MSTNSSPQNSSSDDIDFINLLERTFLFFERYRIAFMIAILVGIAVGCIKYYSSVKMYKSRLILHSSFLTNLEEIEIINSWDELLKRNEYTTLAQSLNCSEVILSKVAGIEGAEILKNYSASNPNGFYIDARILDNSVLPELQKAIVYGLNNTEYVKQKLLFFTLFASHNVSIAMPGTKIGKRGKKASQNQPIAETMQAQKASLYFYSP